MITFFNGNSPKVFILHLLHVCVCVCVCVSLVTVSCPPPPPVDGTRVLLHLPLRARPPASHRVAKPSGLGGPDGFGSTEALSAKPRFWVRSPGSATCSHPTARCPLAPTSCSLTIHLKEESSPWMNVIKMVDMRMVWVFKCTWIVSVCRYIVQKCQHNVCGYISNIG